MKFLVFGVAVLMGACATSRVADPSNLAIGDPGRRERVLPVRAGTILDTRRGDAVTADELAVRLDGARLVFFGETHASAPAQAAELQVLEALARRGRKVLVGLEMLPASVQPALDRWVRGEGDEDELQRGSHWYRHWGFHFGHYRPIFQFARANAAPMFALNVERELITQVRKTGLETLPAAERSKLPPRIDLDNAEHRQLFTAYMGDSHQEMAPAMLEGMFRAQCTWDAVMGWKAVQALEAAADPRAVMVVLIGVGHVAYGLGAERQAALWARSPLPAASIASLEEVTEDGRPRTVRASFADFVWGAPAASKTPLFPALGVTFSETPGSTGATVSAVKAGGAAAKAGLLAGDLVTAIDGVAIPDKETALLEIARKAWGDRMGIEVMRKGAKVTVSAQLTREAPAK